MVRTKFFFYLQLSINPTITHLYVTYSPIRRRIRGNQRDRDRERAQARAGGKAKQPKADGLTPEQRRERDAKALQEKLSRKAAKEFAGAKGGKDGVKTKQ
uniref:putative SERF-like protein n=1 Tax=Erigeron canadensis TaxID=72917 RepID=UPI001CB99B87|nr:putative SERF-like protein [Erigeron canadensis]